MTNPHLVTFNHSLTMYYPVSRLSTPTVIRRCHSEIKHEMKIRFSPPVYKSSNCDILSFTVETVQRLQDTVGETVTTNGGGQHSLSSAVSVIIRPLLATILPRTPRP